MVIRHWWSLDLGGHVRSWWSFDLGGHLDLGGH